MPASVLINGKPGRTVSVFDRGFSYGDGVFETIRVHEGEPEFLAQHLDRLQHSCARLSISCDIDPITNDIQHLLSSKPAQSNTLAVLKVIVTRGNSARGYMAEKSAASTRILMLGPAPKTHFDPKQGVAVEICKTPASINPAIAGIKHLSRLENVLARNECNDQLNFEGLMFDSAGHLIEGTMSNVFLLHAGELATPRLNGSGVAGIIRRLVIERLAPGLEIPVHIRSLNMSDLLSAESVFICNSLIGILPVRKIGCHHKLINDKLLALANRLETLHGA